jgi:hypothetical protein
MLRAATQVARVAAIPLLLFVALAAWAVSSPVGSSPDEDYHLTSIWCGHGTSTGRCETTASTDSRKVPQALPNAACFAFNAEATPTCQDKWFAAGKSRLEITKRGNFGQHASDYPPVFYFVMSLFVGSDVSTSVLLMRLVNAALFVGLATLTFRLLPRQRRPVLLAGGAALVPLGVFLIPSINPSSWAVLSIAVVFPAMVGFFEARGGPRVALGAVATVGTLMGAGARADSAMYAVIAIAVAVLVTSPWRGRNWRVFVLPVVLALACAAFYRTSAQSGAASQVGAGRGGNAHLLIQNFLNIPSLWSGALGSTGLGWLDTPMPSGVWVLSLAGFGAVLFIGLRHVDLSKKIAVLVVLLAALLVPAWVLFQSGEVVGGGIQPRYVLPLLVLLLQVALFRPDVRPEEGAAPGRSLFGGSQVVWICTVVGVTNAIALHVNIQRYVSGLTPFRSNLDSGVQWWWPSLPSPMVVWGLGSAALGAALLLGARSLHAHTGTLADADKDAETPTRVRSGQRPEPALSA